MDPYTDIIQDSSSDSQLSNPSSKYQTTYEVIQKPQRRFFPEDISMYEASIHISPLSENCPAPPPNPHTGNIVNFISPPRTHTFIALNDAWQHSTNITAPTLSLRHETAAVHPTIEATVTQSFNPSRKESVATPTPPSFTTA